MTAFRRYRPSLLSQALVLASLSPWPSLAQQADPQQLDAVTVTGSRIKRMQAEGPAPVQIIGSEETRAQGFTTVYDMLGTLNQAIGTVEAARDAQAGTNGARNRLIGCLKAPTPTLRRIAAMAARGAPAVDVLAPVCRC